MDSDLSTQLTHLDSDGAAQMVDVTDKATSKRVGTAMATIITTEHVMGLLTGGGLPKGEALPVARIAGIMAAKQTSSLIPLCHPLAITGVEVRFSTLVDRVVISATVKTSGVTGVEMEALTAVSVAALTIYDMIKAVDREARITDIALAAKSGGKSGDWQRPEKLFNEN